MIAKFALIAYLSLNPMQPNELSGFVVDHDMAEEDCDAAAERPQMVMLQKGVYLTITNTAVLNCEEQP